MENIDPAGIDFIKGFEGCILHPYLDEGGTPTIGWGFTHYPNGVQVTMNDASLTQAQADEMLTEIVKSYCNAVLAACSPNQNQLNALTSFTYNLGIGAFNASTLLQHVKEGTVVEADFTVYDHVNGQVSVGLLKRREAEYQLFITPIKTMDETTTADVTPATAQTVKLTKVMVSYDKTENGVTIQGEASIPVTPEIVAIFKQTAVEPGWDVIVGE